MSKCDSQVEHPAHYTGTRIMVTVEGKRVLADVECIDVLEALFWDEPHLWNALKYLWRCTKKGNFEQDIEKAIWYLRRRIEHRKVRAL